MQEEKHCPRCKQTKPLNDFTIRKSGRVGHPASYCKVCNCELAKERNQKDDSLYRRVTWPSKLRNQYGIEPADYFRMLEQQGGGCAICAETVPSMRHYSRRGRPEMFHVDHCHKTGAVRGLLCSACNRAIGLIRDNAQFALNIATYLERGK